MLDFIEEQKLKLACIFLTHSHPDHVADLERLETATGAPAYVGENASNCTGRNRFAAGETFGLAV